MNAVTWLFSPVALVIALSIAAVAVLTVVLLPSQEKQVRARLARLKSVSNEGNGSGFSLPSNQFRSVGRWLAATPLIGTDEQAKMEALLSAAGMAGREKVAMFIAIKAVAGLAVGVGGWLSLGYLGIMPNVLVVKAAVVIGSLLLGWRLPDIVVGRRVKRRGAKLSAGFADALDLLVICVEAGLGLEQAMDRVSRDIQQSNPVIAEELGKTVAEMRVLPRMRDALDNFAKRSGLPAVKSVMTTLVQTVQYGTPLAQSMRILSAEMRALRLLQIEERAARLPVLLTLPLIVFILPSLFLIIGGPAMLQVMDIMKK
jgi:tight adherence protein C